MVSDTMLLLLELPKICAGKGKISFGISCGESYKNMPSKHAEIDALYKINTKINIPKKVDIIVVRITRSGQLANSRPCFHCIESLEKSNLNIKYVYYSTTEGTFAKEKFASMKNSPLTYISSGIRNKMKRNMKKINKSQP
jgi:hypothetical protein